MPVGDDTRECNRLHLDAAHGRSCTALGDRL